MPDRTAHPPGTFSWVELATPDPDGAKGFYTGLFGWDFEDVPVAEDIVYTMFKHRSRTAAAAMPSPEGPPRWNSYVSVASADASAARAAELGAVVLATPFDVMDAGRMAVLQDPTGAHVYLWEARGHIGAEVVNEHGSLTWNDLNTRDPEGAQRFYAGLFGWTFARVEEAPIPYWTIMNGERSGGGLRAMDHFPDAVQPHWMPFFAVGDIDVTCETAPRLGGRVDADPMTVPAGRFAFLADPQGATFAVFDGELDD